MSEESASNPFENYQELGATVEEIVEQLEAVLAGVVSEQGEQSVEALVCKSLFSIGHLANGRPDLALANVLEVEDECRAIFGDPSDELVKVNGLTLQCLIVVTKSASTIEEKYVVYRSIVKIFGEDSSTALTYKEGLVISLGQLGRHEEAITLAQSLIAELTLTLGTENEETLRVRGRLARLTLDSGFIEQAIELFESLVSDLKESLGNEHTETLTAQTYLAEALKKSERFSEARSVLEDLLPRQTKTLGEDHEDVLTTRRQIVDALSGEGELDLALEILEQLVQDIDRVLGEKNAFALATKFHYGYLLGQNEEYDEQVEVLEQVVDGYTEVYGAKHEDTLFVRLQHAFAVSQAGDGIDSMPLYGELIPDLEEVLGSSHPDTIRARVNNFRGIVWDEYVENQVLSLLYLEIALHDSLEVYGPEDDLVLELQDDLDCYSWIPNSEYLENWEYNLKVLSERYSNQHPAVFRTRVAIEQIHTWNREYDKAQEQLEILLKDQNEFYGPEHIEVLLTEERVADLLLEQENQSEALALFESIAGRYRDNGEAETPQYFELLFKIAELRNELGETEVTIESLEHIVQDMARIFGESASESIDARRLLAPLIYEKGERERAITMQETVCRDIDKFQKDRREQRIDAHQRLFNWKIEQLSALQGPLHSDVVNLQIEAAEFLIENLRHEVAINILQKLLSLHDKELGDFNEESLRVRKLLVRCFFGDQKLEQLLKLKSHLLHLQDESSEEVIATTQEIIHLAEELKREDVYFEQYQWLLDCNIEDSSIFKTFKFRDSGNKARDIYREKIGLELEEIDKLAESADFDTVFTRYEDLIEYSTKIFRLEEITLDAMHAQAVFVHNSGKWELSVPLYEKVIELRTELYGGPHESLNASIISLGHVLGGLGRWEESFKQLQSVLESRISLFGADHEDVFSVRETFATHYGEGKFYDKAFLEYEKLIQDYKRIYGESHRLVFYARLNQAYYVGQSGDIERSLTLLNGFVENQSAALGEDDEDVALTRAIIARNTADAGYLDEGIALYEILVKQFERVYGVDHENTKAKRAGLAKLLEKKAKRDSTT